MLVRISALLATVFLFSSTPAAARDGIVWQASYEKAFEEANARGVPLLIVIIEDGDEANEDIWTNTLSDASFVEATERTVNLIANRGDEKQHREESVEDGDGKQRRVCGKFGTISCLDHRKVEQGVFRDFARDGMLKTPMVMVVLPDLTIVETLVDRHPLPAFVEAIEKGEKRLPNGVPYDEFLALQSGLEAATKQLADGRADEVIRFVLPYAKRDSNAELVVRAKELLRQVEDAGRAELDAIEKRIQAEEYAPAMEELEKTIDRYRGSIVEKLAKERLATLNKNRVVKAAVAKVKKEQGARDLLEQADKLRDAGDTERAQRLYDRLLEKFADTEAAATLKSRQDKGS
jgi:hypothetical protein